MGNKMLWVLIDDNIHRHGSGGCPVMGLYYVIKNAVQHKKNCGANIEVGGGH